MSIRAGKAYIEFFVEDKEMRKQILAVEDRMRKAGELMTAVGTDIAKVGGLMVAPLVAATKSFSDYGDAMAKMSKRAGVSVETMSALTFAIEQSGGSAEGLDKSFKGMANSLVDAQNGLAASKDAYDRLGLSVDDLLRMNPEKRFITIADAISKLGNEAEQAAVAQDIFGREGYNLLPIIREGAVGINALTKQAKDLGLVMSSEDAAAAEILNDKMNELNKQFKMLTVDIGAKLMPTFMEYAKEIQKHIPALRSWISDNKELIVDILKIGGSLVALGGGLVVVGKLITAFGSLYTVARTTYALMAAHPYVALTAAAVAAGDALGNLAAKTSSLQGDLMDMLETARKIRQEFETDKLFSEVETKELENSLNRLQEFQIFGQLDAKTIGEAKRLVDELNQKFGDLGLSLDLDKGMVTGDIDAARALMTEQTQKASIDRQQQELNRIEAEKAKIIEQATGKELTDVIRDQLADLANEATQTDRALSLEKSRFAAIQAAADAARGQILSKKSNAFKTPEIVNNDKTTLALLEELKKLNQNTTKQAELTRDSIAEYGVVP